MMDTCACPHDEYDDIESIIVSYCHKQSVQSCATYSAMRCKTHYSVRIRLAINITNINTFNLLGAHANANATAAQQLSNNTDAAVAVAADIAGQMRRCEVVVVAEVEV